MLADLVAVFCLLAMPAIIIYSIKSW
jgi:hypothetical protein